MAPFFSFCRGWNRPPAPIRVVPTPSWILNFLVILPTEGIPLYSPGSPHLPCCLERFPSKRYLFGASLSARVFSFSGHPFLHFWCSLSACRDDVLNDNQQCPHGSPQLPVPPRLFSGGILFLSASAPCRHFFPKKPYGFFLDFPPRNQSNSTPESRDYCFWIPFFQSFTQYYQYSCGLVTGRILSEGLFSMNLSSRQS